MTSLIVLDDLHNFAREHSEPPHRTIDRAVYEPFRCIAERLVTSVSDDAGWYIWFKASSPNPPVYVGQSGYGPHSGLRRRLLEELLDELIAFWHPYHPRARTTLRLKYGGRYSLSRAVAKAGADRIAWLPAPTAKCGTLDVVEYKLIQELIPTANLDRRDYSDIELPAYENVASAFRKLLGTPDPERWPHQGG